MTRKWFRRSLVGLAGILVGATAWFLFLPVPLGWVVRFAVGRALPPEESLTIAVDAVTLRWRWGNPALSVAIAGGTLREKAQPLGSVDTVMIEVDKTGLWQGHYTPTRVDVTNPQLTVDLRPGALIAKRAGVPQPTAAATAPRPVLPAGGAVLAPFLAFLPTETQPVLLQLTGLTVDLRNEAGAAKWNFGPIETRATRSGKQVRVEFTAAMAGGTLAPAVALQFEMPVDGLTLSCTIKVPEFSTAQIPSWPGAAALPLQAKIAFEARAEVDLAGERLRSVAGGLVVTEGQLTLPGLPTVIAISRVELRGRAQGEPLIFTFEKGNLEVGGARFEVERLSGTLGPQPRVAWQFAASKLNAAEVIRLLPPETRAKLPVTAEQCAGLELARCELSGEAELVQDAAAGWRPLAFDGRGALRLTNEGSPLAVTWEVKQRDGGPIAVRAAVPALVPAQWAGRIGVDTPVAMLALPVGMDIDAALTPTGALQTATVEVTLGPGNIAAGSALPQELAVRRGEIRLEISQAGHLLRVPKVRIETDGPVVTMQAMEVARQPGAPLAARGEVIVENITDAWLDPWLPKGTLAPLRELGVGPGEFSVARLAVKATATVVTGADGTMRASAVDADLAVGLRVRDVPITVAVRAALNAAGDGVEAAAEVAEFTPAKLRLNPRAGGPGAEVGDFPLNVRLVARAGLDGALRHAAVSLRAGPGKIKAMPSLGVEIPLQSFTLEAEATGDLKRVTVRSLEAEIGAGLRLRGRNVVWHAAAAPHVTGEVDIDGVDLPPLFALLPGELQATSRSQLTAGRLRHARFDFAATESPPEPGGWRIDRLKGEVALEAIRATPAGAGGVACEHVVVALDFPRLTLRLHEATAPAFFNGPLNLALSVDAANREALRAEVLLDAMRVRSLVPEFATMAIMTAPLSVKVELKGLTEAKFSVGASAVLGRALAIDGRAALIGGDRIEADFSNVNFGRTSLGLSVRQPAANHFAVKIESARIDADELVQAAAPFLGDIGSSKASGEAKATEAKRSAVAVGQPPAAKAPAAPVTWNIESDFAAIELGRGRAIQGLTARAKLIGDWPETVLVQGTEGTGNSLHIEVGGPAAKQTIHFSAGDASAWFAALVTPLVSRPLPKGELATLAKEMGQYASMVTGGKVDLRGELADRKQFTGSVALARATLQRSPRILQMLALKSGKTSADQPFIEKFSINRIVADLETLAGRAEGVEIVGSGLIDRLKVKSASYRAGDGKLGVDGEYFGVGFEVVGTRADPQVFLKDNSLLVRAVGQPLEFDFEAMATDAKAKAVKDAELKAAKKP